MPGFVASVQSNVIVPIGLTHLYYICFLSGFVISASVYCFLHFLFPAQACSDFVESSPAAAILMAKYEQTWDGFNGGALSEDVDKSARTGTREISFD